MATDRIQLQALRSKDVLSGSTADLEVAKYFDGVNSPKLPTADQLEFGEIAVNIAKGYEVIAIKNYDGEVVYLPFNVASKLLAQEATLDELKEYAYSSIEELSGYTVSSFGSVNAFLDELNTKIDNCINSVSSGLTEQILELSANTFNTIIAVTEQLHEEIRDAISGNTIIDEIIEERFNAKINDLSATTISLIESVSGETNQKIDNVNDSLSEKIDGLSAYTINITDELDERITLLSGSSDAKFNLLESSLNERIDNFSADTQDKLFQIVQDFNASFTDLSGKTESEIKDLYDTLYRELNELSDYVDFSVSNLSGDTQEKLDNVYSELIDKINAVSAATESTIGKAILDKINELSAKTISDKIELENTINSNRAEVEVEVYNLSSATDSKFDTFSGETDNKLSELKSTLEEEIRKATSGSSGNIDYIVEKLNQRIDITSADSAVRDEEIIGRINKLSAQTFDEIEALGSTIDDIIEYIVDGDEYIKEKIEELSAQTDTRINNVYDYLTSADNKLKDEVSKSASSYTDTKIDEVNSRVDSLSATTKENIDKLYSDVKDSENRLKDEISKSASSYTDTKVDAVNSRIDSLSATAKEAIDKVYSDVKDSENKLKDEVTAISSAYTDSQIEDVNYRIDKLTQDTSGSTTDLGNKINELDSKIDSLSASTKEELLSAVNDLNDKIKESADDILFKSSAYTDSSITSLSGSVKNVTDELANGIAIVSSDTKSRIDNLKLNDLSDVDTTKEVGDGIEVITKSGDTWVNTTIGLASKDKEGLVKIGSGLTSDNGVVSVIPIEIDDKVTSASTNPVSGKAVYREIDGINRRIDGVDESISALTKSVDEVDDNFYSLSANTEERLSGFSDTISAFTVEIRSELNENSLVQAAALAKQNFELGFNENAEFQPESEKLQGRSVTGALDYLDEKISTYESTCNQNYDDLEQKVIDDEKVHAGYAARINYSLGFDKNAIYTPETPFLKGRTVTEAIDVLYEKVGEDIDSSVLSAKTEIYNVVNNEINTLSSDTEARLDEFADYLYSEQSMHFERSVTYENLVKLVKQSKLRWGMLYRLTNYQATVDSGLVNASTRLQVVDSGQNTNNGFDIILRATSNNTLNENCRFMKSVNSEYFEDCALESWEGKYSLKNDHTRFEWADENGFGVIYYMKDNFGNEAHYDFKNIVFGDDKLFTFNPSYVVRDGSMTGEAKNNVINPYYDQYNRLNLNNVIFKSDNAIGNTIFSNTKNLVLSGEQVNNMVSNTKTGSSIGSSMYTFHGFKMVSPVNPKPYVDSESEIENPEFNMVILDSEQKVLYGLRVDNTEYEPDLNDYFIDGICVGEIITALKQQYNN